MSDFEIHLERTAFRPGEALVGRAVWRLISSPRRVELRLVWSTSGRGEEDMGIAVIKPLSRLTNGDELFSIKLPEAPYSFCGQLISVLWRLELVAEPGSHGTSVGIVLGPENRAILLRAR